MLIIQSSCLTFLERQHRESLGSVSCSLRKYDEFLPLLLGPGPHVVDLLVTRLALPVDELRPTEPAGQAEGLNVEQFSLGDWPGVLQQRPDLEERHQVDGGLVVDHHHGCCGTLQQLAALDVEGDRDLQYHQGQDVEPVLSVTML